MKKTMIMLSLVLVSWGANAQHDHSKMGHSTEEHSKMESRKAKESMVQPSVNVERSKSASAIIDNYLELKDALVADNSDNAAKAGKSLAGTLAKFDVSTQPQSRQKELTEIIESAKKQAGYISENEGNIKHQRESFEQLSMEIKDLVVITGSDRNLYEEYCPMYNNNKGGMWLSASDEIRNPFYGNKMLKCGSVQKEILVK